MIPRTGAERAPMPSAPALGSEEERRRRRRRRLLLLLLLVASALPSVVTSVWSVTTFLDSAATPGIGSWSLGSVDVHAAPTLSIEATQMLPGDRRFGEIVLENRGATTARYAVMVHARDAGGDGLAAALAVEFAVTDGNCRDAGKPAWRGPLAHAALGDAAPGLQAGDQELAPATRETLCVAVELPIAAPDRLQDARAVATFTVVAEPAGPAP